jgi:cell division protein FtsL
MKESYKSVILKYLFGLFSVMVFILSYVGLKLRVDSMKKEIVVLNEKAAFMSNLKTDLLVKKQLLSSEDRITTIAVNELGLDYYHSVPLEIKVDNDEVKRIQKIIDQKYEHQ